MVLEATDRHSIASFRVAHPDWTAEEIANACGENLRSTHVTMTTRRMPMTTTKARKIANGLRTPTRVCKRTAQHAACVINVGADPPERHNEQHGQVDHKLSEDERVREEVKREREALEMEKEDRRLGKQ